MNLTQKLKEFDFMCAFEQELYFLTIGETTTLFIEAVPDPRYGVVYLLYKQNYGRFSRVEYLGRNLREQQLINRLENYFRIRQKRMLKKLKDKGRGFPVKTRKALSGDLLTKKRADKMG